MASGGHVHFQLVLRRRRGERQSEPELKQAFWTAAGFSWKGCQDLPSIGSVVRHFKVL